MTAAIRPPEWQLDAACAEIDVDLWFPEVGEDSTAAKRVCLTCRVRTDCLTHALVTGEPHGIRGGLSPRQRVKLRRENYRELAS